MASLFLLFWLSCFSFPCFAWCEPENTEAKKPVIILSFSDTISPRSIYGKLDSLLREDGFRVVKVNLQVSDKNGEASDIKSLGWKLGKTLKKICRKHRVDSIDIIADSLSGMVVACYVLNLAKSEDGEPVFYNEEIGRVVFVQTPFFGCMENSGADQRFGQLSSELRYGSSTINEITDALVKTACGDLFSDALYLLRSDDSNIAVSATIQFSRKSHDDGLYFYMQKGGKEVSNSQSRAPILAGLQESNDSRYVALSSYLRGSLPKKKIGRKRLHTLILRNNSGEFNNSNYLLSRVSGGSGIHPHINLSTGVVSFFNLAPGRFILKTQSSSGESYGRTFYIQPASHMLAHFKESSSLIIDSIRSLIAGDNGAVFSLPSLTFGLDDREAVWKRLPGLNPKSFEIEFSVDRARQADFYKGRIFVIFNNRGSLENKLLQNGSRFELLVIGSATPEGVKSLSGKIALIIYSDKNQNGKVDVSDKEANSFVSEKIFNWRNRHDFLINLEATADSTIVKIAVDGRVALRVVATGSYYNPAPAISFGGRWFDEDYQVPRGAEILDFSIRNGN